MGEKTASRQVALGGQHGGRSVGLQLIQQSHALDNRDDPHVVIHSDSTARRREVEISSLHLKRLLIVKSHASVYSIWGSPVLRLHRRGCEGLFRARPSSRNGALKKSLQAFLDPTMACREGWRVFKRPWWTQRVCHTWMRLWKGRERDCREGSRLVYPPATPV